MTGASVKVVSGTAVVAEGTTETISEKKLPEGTYEVTVSKEGYVSDTKQVVVKNGEVTTVTVNLVLETDKVVGIKSDNLVTFDVEFSKPVDEKTITAESFKVYKNSNTSPLNQGTQYTYMLSDDNKSIKVIDLSNSEQLTKYKVVVEGIKTKDTKKEFEKSEKEITLKDTTVPTVTNIEITSKKTVKVYYSEPMNIKNDSTMVLDNELKINGAQVLKSKDDFSIKDNCVVYTLDKALTTGTYEISTEGAKDFAGWKTAETKKTVSYVVKTTAPTIVSATAKEKNKISVEFSAPLDKTGIIEMGKAGSQAKFDLSLPIYATGSSLAEKANNAYNTIKTPGNVSIVRISDTKFDFYFSDNYALTTADIVESVIKYNKLKDYDGNEVTSEQKFKFQAYNDNDIPTVTGVKTEGQKLVISFSEAMDQGLAETPTNYVFKAKTGVKEFNPIIASYDSYNNAVTLTFKSDDVSNAGGTFSMTVKNLKDASVRANDMAVVTKDVTFADTKAPTVSKVEVVKGDDKVTSQKLIVSFDKPMNKESIENLSNYILAFGGQKVVLSNWSENGKKATAVAGTGNQSVTITLGGLYSDKIDGTLSINSNKGIDIGYDKLTVLGVKDSLGNVYVDVTEAKGITEYKESVDFATTVKSIELTSRDTIKVTLKDDASVFDKAYAGEFVIWEYNTEATRYDESSVKPYKAEISADKKSVTLTLNGKLAATAKSDNSNSYKLTIRPEANNAKTFNVAGQYFKDATPMVVTDKTASSVDKVMSTAKAKVVDGSTYNSLDSSCIVVKLDEAVTGNENIVPTLFTVKVDDTTLSYSDGDYSLVKLDGTTPYDGTSTDTFVIKVLKNGINAKKATVALTDGSYLKDVNGNKANAFTAKDVEMKDDADAIKETTVPEVKTLLHKADTLNAGDYKLEFTEELNDASKVLVEEMVKNALSATGEGNSFEIKWAGSTLNVKVTGSVTLLALNPGAGAGITVKDIVGNSSLPLAVGDLQASGE